MPRPITTFDGVGQTRMWTMPHRAKAHIIGCRVMANTPLGSRAARSAPPGPGSAGLPKKEPTRRMLASSMKSAPAIHSQSGVSHSGGSGGIARAARMIQAKVASATIE